jgi:hypothetical protein
MLYRNTRTQCKGILLYLVSVHAGREIGGGEIEIVKESQKGTPRAVDQKVHATAAKHAQVLLHRRIRQPPFLGLVPRPQPNPFLVCEYTAYTQKNTHTHTVKSGILSVTM